MQILPYNFGDTKRTPTYGNVSWFYPLVLSRSKNKVPSHSGFQHTYLHSSRIVKLAWFRYPVLLLVLLME